MIISISSLPRRALAGAFLILLAACGGDQAAPPSQAAAPADSAGPSFSTAPDPKTVPADSAAAAAPAVDRRAELAEAILQAPATGPVNAGVVEDYRLTMDGIRKLVRAGQSLGELQARRPDLRDSMRLGTFDPNGMFEKLSSIPAVRDAIGEAGMTPREYATATAALMQAAMVRQMRSQGLSPQVQVSEANVRFVDENWNEIQQILRAAAAQVPPQP